MFKNMKDQVMYYIRKREGKHRIREEKQRVIKIIDNFQFVKQVSMYTVFTVFVMLFTYIFKYSSIHLMIKEGLAFLMNN
jgi:hypothetical protein